MGGAFQTSDEMSKLSPRFWSTHCFQSTDCTAIMSYASYQKDLCAAMDVVVSNNACFCCAKFCSQKRQFRCRQYRLLLSQHELQLELIIDVISGEHKGLDNYQERHLALQPCTFSCPESRCINLSRTAVCACTTIRRCAV